MPKITNLTKRIAGTLYQLVLSYNQKEKFHISAGIPEKMASLVNANTLQDHDTERSLTTELDRLVLEYEAKLKTERKVLLVTACVGREMYEPLNLSYKDGHPLISTNTGFDAGPRNYGFDFKVEIALETSVGEKKTYRYEGTVEATSEQHRRTGRYPSIEKNTQVIEHTPEREDFFKNLMVATIGLGERLRDFFNADEQLFLANIDSGRKLLS